MQKQRKTGIIAGIVLISVVALSFIFMNISDFKDILFNSDSVNILLLMILYAIIPCVPAVILRVKFGFQAVKWLMLSATVIGVSCCVLQIILPESALDENSWIFVFTQCALTSSVPVLYCAAFMGKCREISVALTPSLLFFMSLCVRQMLFSDTLDTAAYIFSGSVIMMFLTSLSYTLWALLLILISFLIYRVLNFPKINNALKSNKKIEFISVAGMVFLAAVISVLIILFLPPAPKPVFEISLASDEFHGEYDFEIAQKGEYRLIISSDSQNWDILATVHITGDAFGEIRTIYEIARAGITEDLMIELKPGVYTVTIDLNHVNWGDELEITPAKFKMIIMPLVASEKNK